MAKVIKRPAARKKSLKGQPDNSALIRAINPPDEVLPYDPMVMQALQDRHAKDVDRVQQARMTLQRQLYLAVFPWWEPEIQGAMKYPLRDGWEKRLQAIYAKADKEWTKLSGLPPLICWNNLDWRRAAKIAGYSGDSHQTIVDGLIVRFTQEKTEKQQHLTEPMTLKEIGNWFSQSRNYVRRLVLEKYWHDAVGRKFRMRVADMPAPYHVHHTSQRK